MWLCYTRLGKLLLLPHILKGTHLKRLSGEFIPEAPTLDPRALAPPPPPLDEEDRSEKNREIIERLLSYEDDVGDGDRFRFWSVRDYYRAYREKRCTPVKVAEALIAAIKETNAMKPPLRGIVDYNEREIMQMATASDIRWREGKPLSPLDGVPVSIKAEFRTKPYAFRCGSLFEPIFTENTPESNLVQNLKEAGAIIIGLTNMIEFGTGVLGSNPNRFNRTPRNPYNTDCFAGGSSSGSAVSVAAGLCPISLGADAGGSIRIPAGLCGLFGIKPTLGLIESTGGMPLTTLLCAPGPLCGSALDTIIAMDTLSLDSSGNKTISLQGITDGTLEGVRIGVYRQFFEHCEDSVRKVALSSLQVLESLGAVLVDVKIPELEETRVAHLVTVVSEFSTNLACDVDRHFDIFNPETLLLLFPGFHCPATDFINAQKQRTRAVMFLKKIFEEVDVIATPMTACLAPRIDKDALSHGKIMANVSGKLSRYAFLANVTGNPAISCPIGVSMEGLPVGLQFVGRWYDERALLSIAWCLERSGRFPATRPSVFCDILKTATGE